MNTQDIYILLVVAFLGFIYALVKKHFRNQKDQIRILEEIARAQGVAEDRIHPAPAE